MKHMEQWPPLVKEVTPKTNGTIMATSNMGSNSNADLRCEIQHDSKEAEASTRDTAQRKLDMTPEPAKKWANFFDTNRLSAKGMSLNYVAPIMKNGEKVIELNKEEVDKATEEWKQALILYVVGTSPTIAAVERYIATQVNTVSKPKVYYHNDGYFLVRFTSLDDRNELLYSGPHMMNNKPIIVKIWSADFDFNKELLQTIPIWVKYPNLPLNCLSMDSLSRISSGLGVPVYADECTTKVDRISFARVLVEMDVARELPKKIKVEDPNGRVFDQVIQYEWVPEYCTKCMQIGHKCQLKDGPRNRPAPKIVSKWLQKPDENVVEGQSKQGNKQDATVEKREEEAAAWEQVSNKSAARGNLGGPSKSQNMRVTNGFESLSNADQGTTSITGEQGGQRMSKGGNTTVLAT